MRVLILDDGLSEFSRISGILISVPVLPCHGEEVIDRPVSLLISRNRLNECP